MKSLDRKLLRELWHSRGLLIAITTIIAVGVMCYVALQSCYRNLQQAKAQYYREGSMADFWIEVKKAPLADLEVVATLPGVTRIYSRISSAATVDLENGDKPVNAVMLSLPLRREEALCNLHMRRGDYFTDRRDNEVIVNDAFARANRLRPGQTIHLILNNRRQELFIVGTAMSCEYVYVLGPGSITPDPAHFGVFYVKQRFAEEVFDFDGAANQVLGQVSREMRPVPEHLLQRAEALLDEFGVISTTALKFQPSNQFLTNEIGGLGAMASIMPTAFLLVAALVLNVLIGRLAKQQRVIIGTLKALGYSDIQILFHFLKFGLAIGAVGGTLGCFFGYWLAAGMTIMYRSFFEFPELASHFHWDTSLSGLMVSLGFAVVGTLIGARTAVRLQPAEAMRSEPPKSGGAILLERIAWFWNRLDSAWRVALRGMFRNRLRMAAGVVAAALGTGLLSGALMMQACVFYLLDFQFEKVLRSDIDLTFKDERGIEAIDELRRLPGVDRVEPQLNISCTLINGPYRRKSGLTGMEPNSRLTIPRNQQGEPIRVPPSGLVMSRRLAEIMHLSPGDTVSILPVKGERRERTAVVADITDTYLGMACYGDIRYLSHLMDEEYAVSGAQIKIDGNEQRVRQLYRELKELPGIQAVSSRHDLVSNLTDTLIRNQRVFIGVLIALAGIMLGGSILNASLVNLAERQREVATLAAQGYTPWGIGASFFRETMVTATLGALIGLPMGYGLTKLTIWGYENDVARLPLVVPPSVLITSFLLALGFALAAHAVVQRRIFQIDILESLKVRE